MTPAADLPVRPIGREDAPALEEMLYLAIHVPSGAEAPPREIIRQPELARYIEGWGRAGDIGLLALDPLEGRPIGAAWLRLLTGGDRGYGHVDDATPELSIAVSPGHRGLGLGGRLLRELIARARGHYPAISLSVSIGNPAIRLYQRAGFTAVRTEGGSLVMKLDL
jgi:ribosomal protein S18 acetylase RimI-like enzyme